MEIKYSNAVVYIYGKVDRERIEESTIEFMTKVQRSKKNGNNDKTRTIKEK